MWPFTKYLTYAESGILEGFTDYHCHLLPGVDDGIQKMEDTLKVLALYEQVGIEEVWLTPHIMEDVPNTTAHLRERFEDLKATYQGKVTLHLAAENMMDNLFEERLEAKDLLPIGAEQNHLLVETSYFNPPMDLWGILEQVKSAGYFPLLAHPERYVYMERDDYDRLKEMDVRFQMNLPSLVGMYGKHVQQKAEYLLKKGYYNLAGSDTHRFGQARMCLTERKMKESLIKKLNGQYHKL